MPHLSEIIRRKAYWFLDFATGKKVKRHYNEIKTILLDTNLEQVREVRRKNLNALLVHATKTTPFYKGYANFLELQDFPIIDKNLITDQYDTFKSRQKGNPKLYGATSSGSTGIPFTIYQDKIKRDRNTADVIHFTERAGGLVGDKLFYIKLWDHTNEKNNWLAYLQNIVAHNVMDTSERDLEELVAQMQKSSSAKTVLGYPSFFEELCNYLDRRETKPKIQEVNCVISMAEALKQQERDRMSSYFNAGVYERYSNQENGILAQQTKESQGNYVLNWASYHIEVLELDSDKHVRSGGLGRIVVTDLFNYSMPMIRYDTGDMAIYEENPNGLPYLSKIYGRRMDTIYNTNGEIVSPFIFYMVLDFSKIKQFQFVQTKRNEYLFKLNGNPQDVEEGEITKYFKKYLGDDAVIEFAYVKEIPLLSSGKRKKIVNEFMTS